MQYHLIAFAPFALMAGTALMAAGLSVFVKMTSSKVRISGLPVMAPKPVVPVRSAEILYFPAQMRRPVALPVMADGVASVTSVPALRLIHGRF